MNKALLCMALSCACVSLPIVATAAAATHSQAQAATATISTKINLNKASAQELLHAIKGIGKKRADAIVAYRSAHAFQSIDDLARVKGFGPRYVKTHRDELEARFSVSG